MKKILVFILAAAMCLSLTACGANSPDKTVAGMMDSIKTWDIEAMKKYIPADEFYSEFNDTESMADTSATMKLLTANMSYKITGTKVNGDSATVNVDITNVDMKPVFEDMFTQLFALAFSGVDLTDEAVAEQKVMEILKTSIDNNKSTTVTNAVSVTLTKGKEGWAIDEPSEAFFDAVLGGFISAADDTSSMFESEE